jgi:hypothetical protein
MKEIEGPQGFTTDEVPTEDTKFSQPEGKPRFINPLL